MSPITMLVIFEMHFTSIFKSIIAVCKTHVPFGFVLYKLKLFSFQVSCFDLWLNTYVKGILCVFCFYTCLHFLLLYILKSSKLVINKIIWLEQCVPNSNHIILLITKFTFKELLIQLFLTA